MYKQEIIAKFKQNAKDTGSMEVQIALTTHKIKSLSEHAKVHKKDNHSKRGLIMHVEKRKKMLSYLKKEDEARYKAILQALELRK